MVEIKTVELDDLLKTLAEMNVDAQEKYNLLVEKFKLEALKDVRSLYFHNLASTIQTYYFAIELTKFFPQLEVAKRLPGKTVQDQAEALGALRNSYLDEMKSSLLVSFFVNFEICLRIIAKHKVWEVKSETAFEKVIKKMIAETQMEVDVLSLFQILIYVRNTMHYSGIQTKESHTKSYKGREYKFEQGKPVSFLDVNEILYLLKEATKSVYDLILTPSICEEDFIEHPSAQIFTKNGM